MNEPIQKGLEDALRRLREQDAALGAPQALEPKLLEAFRAHNPARGKGRRWLWVPVAVAASVALVVASRMSEPMRVEVPAAPAVAATRPAAKPGVERLPVETVSARKPKPKPSRKRRATAVAPRLSLASSRPAVAPATQQQQNFVKIPYAPPFTSDDEGLIVRVDMPGASARNMGVPVSLERVQADLVVGRDGLPRAIRLVSYP